MRRLVHQRRAAARELDHVAGKRAQTERRRVDESELSLLNRRQRAARPVAQPLRENEDRSERRAHVVRHLDDELLRVLA